MGQLELTPPRDGGHSVDDPGQRASHPRLQTAAHGICTGYPPSYEQAPSSKNPGIRAGHQRDGMPARAQPDREEPLS